MSARRPGVVLVTAVLVLLALGTLAAGMLFTATQEVRIARAGEDAARTRIAAESAARWVIATWRSRDYRDLPVGGTRLLAPPVERLPRLARYDLSVERLTRSRFLVRAEAVHGSGARFAIGAALLVLDPDELWRSFPAALTAASPPQVATGADVRGYGAAEPPQPWPADACPADPAVDLWRVFGDPDRPGVSLLEAPTDGADPSPITGPQGGGAGDVRLGPLGPTALRALADRIEAAGAAAPRPATHDGECATDAPGNWGAPLDPTGPCGGYAPLIFAPGDLRIAGGAGQGILVVQGDLTLADGARFYGPILVGGRLLVTGDAAVYGAVTATGGGPDQVDAGAHILYSACAIRRSLLGAAALDQPLAAGDRVWVPLF